MKEFLCKHQLTYFATNLSTLISICQGEASEFFAMPLTPKICMKCPNRDPVTQEAINNHINDIAKIVGDQMPLVNELVNNLKSNIEKFCHTCAYFDSTIGLCRACNCGGSFLPIEERARLFNFSCPLNLW